MSRPIITPQRLRGFRDLLPADATIQRVMLRRIEDSFTAHGFLPLVTPALEYLAILKGKGGEESDTGLFEFADRGGRQVAMRYDLTVPLARYVAQHQNELTFPFRSSQIGYVWRGDRPQKGRFRELIQCDADIIGATGPVVDAEVIALMHTTLQRLGLGEFTIRVNDRRLLDALLTGLGVEAGTVAVLRSIDKLEKIGAEGVERELLDTGLEATAIKQILDFAAAGGSKSTAQLDDVAALVEPHADGAQALDGLRQVFELLEAAGVPRTRFVFDPSIARGLDYYTGVVFETTLAQAPDIGSVSSGGRYDDLAGLFTRTRLPGVGGTIGISRILGGLEKGEIVGELDEIRPLVVVTVPEDRALRPNAVALAAALRRGPLDAQIELYPGEQPHRAQMKYGGARGARVVLTLGPADHVLVKDMVSGATEHSSPEQTAAAVAEVLERPVP